MREDRSAGIRQQALLPLGRPQGEPSHNLEEVQVGPATLSATTTPSTRMVPQRGAAGSDPWPGVTRAQGCAWACWLISPWPPAGRPPAQAATREGREAGEPRQTGPATWSIHVS